MSDEEVELARRLARFKLSVRRTLGVSVNLDALLVDLDYRTRILSEIEELTDDEELLVNLLLVRDLLSKKHDSTDDEAGTKPVRDYRFGARSG